MPTIVQTVNGTVTGLWGSALRRTPAGKLITLKMGDPVMKGDVILTTQDGIVQITPDQLKRHIEPCRVLAELEREDIKRGDIGHIRPGERSLKEIDIVGIAVRRPVLRPGAGRIDVIVQ